MIVMTFPRIGARAFVPDCREIGEIVGSVTHGFCGLDYTEFTIRLADGRRIKRRANEIARADNVAVLGGQVTAPCDVEPATGPEVA